MINVVYTYLLMFYNKCCLQVSTYVYNKCCLQESTYVLL